VSIFIDENTRVVVQGITGRDGSFHAAQMRDYGTPVVAGVTPGKGGSLFQDAVPVFNTVREAVDATGANTSVIYVRAQFAFDAICEAADGGAKLIVCITEGIPVRDMAKALPFVASRGARLIGANCPGIIAPAKRVKVGILPTGIFKPGSIGVVSRSGTLTYEVVYQLSRRGFGESTCVGIGGDPLVGTNFIDALEAFENDDETEAVVLIGEIGGTDEQEAAELIKSRMSKPVVAFVAGQTAPEGKRMGHAGAIVSGSAGTAKEKIEAFRAAGVPVARVPSEISGLVADALGRAGGPGANPARRAGPGSARSRTMSTLLMIKPDMVEKGRHGEIISCVLKNRFEVANLRMVRLDRERAERFYEVHRGKEFYPSLVDYVTSGPVVAMEIVGGDDLIAKVRAFVGATDPAKAAPGTVRRLFGISIQHNAVHASDSPEAAKKELAIAFGGP
jgi:succinyl-CoA synthetase alpha subunit